MKIDKDEWYRVGEWTDITLLGVDTWNGRYNSQVMNEFIGKTVDVIVFHKDNKVESIYFSKESEKELGELVKTKYNQDNKIFDKIFSEYLKQWEKDFQRINEISKMGLSDLSNEQLIELFWETRKLIGFSGAYDWFPFSFDSKIIDAVGLREYIEKNPDEKDLILDLTVPPVILPTLGEGIAVMKLAEKVKGNSKEEILSEFKEDLDGLSEKYGWLASLVLYPNKSADEYAEDVLKIINEGNVADKLKEKESYVDMINKKLEKYISEKNPPEEVVNAIHAMRKLTETRAVGEMNSLYCFNRSRNVDKEIQNRLKISSEDYYLLYMEEVVSMLNAESELPEMTQRKKMVGLVRKPNGVFEEIENAENIYNDLQIEVKDEAILKGMPGCPGNAKGTVKVIHSTQDISKFNEGDILVAKATCIDYVVIMKKSGAILTEYGGITSHAAIVSRELNVPAVIAIPNLTKILKDGDVVEVDAKAGIVRRVEDGK